MVMKSLLPGEEELELPAYTLPEAAGYVDMPVTTLRAWVRGISYPTERGRKRSDAILVLPDPRTPLLSFTNLIEAFVLNSIRKRYGVSLQKVRKALRNLPPYSSGATGCKG
jgi:hypothetical protein